MFFLSFKCFKKKKKRNKQLGLFGGGGPQVGVVTRLGGVTRGKNKTKKKD